MPSAREALIVFLSAGVVACAARPAPVLPTNTVNPVAFACPAPPRDDAHVFDCLDEHRCSDVDLARAGPAALPRLIRLLDHPDEAIRWKAERAIRLMGLAARSAGPAVMDAEARLNSAGHTLFEIGDEARAAEVFARSVDPHRFPQGRFSWDRDLGGTFSTKDAAALVAVLVDPASTRDDWAAAHAVLSRTKVLTTEALAVLLEGLVLEQGRARVATPAPGLEGGRLALETRLEFQLSAIAMFEEMALPAVPTLRILEHAGGWRTRELARSALVAVRGEDCLRIANEDLTDADSQRQSEAAYTLGKLGARARSAVPALVARLRGPPWDTLPEIATALGAIGDARAVAPLTSAIDGPNIAVAAEAAKALAHLGGAACAALPTLRKARGHWSLQVRWEAARAVSALAGGRIEPAPISERSANRRDLLAIASEGVVGARTLEPKPSAPGCEALGEQTVRVGDECVVGVDRGEWGGALGVAPAGATQARLLSGRMLKGVVALFPWQGGALAIVGSDHMGSWPTRLMTVSRKAQGAWVITTLAELPGYPSGCVVGSDEVVVATREWIPPAGRLSPGHIAAFGIDGAGHVRRLAIAW